MIVFSIGCSIFCVLILIFKPVYWCFVCSSLVYSVLLFTVKNICSQFSQNCENSSQVKPNMMREANLLFCNKFTSVKPLINFPDHYFNKILLSVQAEYADRVI